MIDDEFSIGEPRWHRVRVKTWLQRHSAELWLIRMGHQGEFTVIWGRDYYDFYFENNNLAFEVKLRFG